MQTIKTAVVVLLLLAVSYGAFVALNSPDPELPASIEEWASGDEQLEKLVGMDIAEFDGTMTDAQPISAEELLAGMKNEPANAVASAENALKQLPELRMPALPDVGGNGLELGQSMAGGDSIPPLPAPTDGSTIEMPQLSDPPDLSSFPDLNSSATNTPPNSNSATIGMGAGNSPANGTNQNLLPPSIPGSGSGTNSLIPANLDELTKLVPGSTGAPPTSLASSSTNVPADAAISAGTPSPTRMTDPTAIKPPTEKFAMARLKALQLAGAGDLKDALVLLTPYYHSPELGTAESEDLVNILDALSREVIYSNRHFLAAAHVARPMDSVAKVAEQYSMTPELLNSINGLGDAKALVPGTQLKVIQGPFNARISVSKQELTLFLQDMYAGRFPISLGRDPQPQAGIFEVVDRQRNRTYYGAGSVHLPGDDPRNPYGGFWINLGNEQCIHGTAEMESSELANAGCVSLAPLDARDVFNILTIGSQVVIIE